MDADDLQEAIETAAYVGRAKASYGSNVPAVAGEKAIRLFRARLKAFLEQIPDELSVGEIRELLAPQASDGDDE